jgi:hypothetical protein
LFELQSPSKVLAATFGWCLFNECGCCYFSIKYSLFIFGVCLISLQRARSNGHSLFLHVGWASLCTGLFTFTPFVTLLSLACSTVDFTAPTVFILPEWMGRRAACFYNRAIVLKVMDAALKVEAACLPSTLCAALLRVHTFVPGGSDLTE